MSTTLSDRLEAVRQQALAGGLPVRRKDRDLYGLLSACLELCEEVLRDELEPELRELFRVSVAGQGLSVDEARVGKRFTYKSSDAFVLVCRYALGGTETPQLTSRYASALREANRRQITSARLADYLRRNGGVLALYRSRPTVGHRSGGLRTLELDRTVDVPLTGLPFTLQLRFNGRGFFEVLSPDPSDNETTPT